MQRQAVVQVFETLEYSSSNQYNLLLYVWAAAELHLYQTGSTRWLRFLHAQFKQKNTKIYAGCITFCLRSIVWRVYGSTQQSIFGCHLFIDYRVRINTRECFKDYNLH